MKDYNLTVQENDFYCVSSVLQAVFRRRGLEFSQRKIARSLTRSQNGFEVDDNKIKDFMKRNKFDYFYYDYNATPFNEHDSLLKDMNDYEGIFGINSHCYLLEEFKDPNLIYLNPDDGNLIRDDIYSVVRNMNKHFGFFGLIKYID